ncbi:MAG: AAA family ATPase [Peptococcaceae bacterium]|nr:AAA family ATPase [Peptococcaceae bacterium]
MSLVVAIANQKGGVAKTTTAVNLGACLAELGKKVLIVDSDPQGNASSGLGTDRENLGLCLYSVIIDNEPIEEIIITTGTEGLFLAPASIQLAGAEIELVSAIAREHKLRKAIESIRNDYDYIIIDCPPSLGLLTVNALTAADRVLVPIQCEYYALEGLSLLMNTIALVQKHLNRELDVLGVLLTMFDARTNLAIQVVDEVKAYYPGKVFRCIVPRNVRLSEAPSHGLPIISYDPKSKGAEVYRELAKEVIELE